MFPGAFGLAVYGIVFSIANEMRISTKVAVTAIGIASIICYTPYLFMSTMFGGWLDTYGNAGYNIIFIFLASLGALVVVMLFIVRKYSKRCELLEIQAQKSVEKL